MAKGEKQIYVCGTGPGHTDYILPRVYECIQNSTLIVGAFRLLALFRLEGKEVYEVRTDFSSLAEKVKNTSGNCTILVSGDSGFYSLASTLKSYFTSADLIFEPGISTYQYFFSRLGLSYEDAYLGSVHGRTANVASIVHRYKTSFWLTDEQMSWKHIAERLEKAGLGNCRMHVGSRLSYPDERVISSTASALANMDKTLPLCAVIIENDTTGCSGGFMYNRIADGAFIRDNVPMTKEEIRTLSIAKLDLQSDSHAVDIGAGTGSVSVQMAQSLVNGQVYAVEYKPEAIELIERNKALFVLDNLHLIAGKAPEALTGLTTIDRIFIGGSAGELQAILEWVKSNVRPGARIVINAVTLDTLELARHMLHCAPFSDMEIIQVAVSRIQKTGNTAMLQAQTPVFILSATLI